MKSYVMKKSDIIEHVHCADNFDLVEELGKYITKIHAEVVDRTDTVIVEAIINAAKDAGVTDLYLIDKTFVVDAILEKCRREGIK